MALNKKDNSTDNVYQYVGNKLRSYRVSKRLTQTDVAKYLDISPQQYQKYEDAQSKCSLTTLFKFVELLEIDINDVLPLNVEEEQNANETQPHNSQDQAYLVSQLVASFMKLPSDEARLRFVKFLESIV